MNDLKERVLQFLYKQVSENKIPTIRKGMVEEFESFVLNELTLADSQRMAGRLNSTGNAPGNAAFSLAHDEEK